MRGWTHKIGFKSQQVVQQACLGTWESLYQEKSWVMIPASTISLKGKVISRLQSREELFFSFLLTDIFLHNIGLSLNEVV